MNSPSILRRASLYRSLALPFSAFVLATSAALAAWLAWGNRQESLARLGQIAVTNAEFVEELRLPHSEALANKLSTILGAAVRFDDGAGTIRQSDDWPSDLPAIPPFGSATTQRLAGYDLARAPIPDSADVLVLVAESRGGWAKGMGRAVLMPAATVTLACAALALLMAHRIVRPLGLLTRWLPNLQGHDPVPSPLAGRTDEIGQLARALENTHARLRTEQERRQQSERLAVLGRIATSLAHEIRNPVAAIRLHANLAASGSGSPESLTLIAEEADQVDDLVNQWLFVARPAAPETGDHALGDLVDEVARRLRPSLDHQGARLTLSQPETPLLVRCDRPRMLQVLRNLVLNAAQAMPEGGEIHAAITPDADHAILTLSDQGPGFSSEALKRFGEAFFSEREGGMGIGLTLASEVVAGHGGTLEATNTPSGATVRLRLPRAPMPQ